MAYVALYRKYRSQSFDELMGQEQVTTTLQNALRTGRIAHAYLFYGARGCGKTSTARLLARALNCEAQEGPTPDPCGHCRLCIAVRDGHCLDVIEMDAASETGIDDVREKIVENVQYAPGEARYKVYIIDEVHDLSAKAFDALLKTLEEPPPHVVFVLATTELHKVPITIRSRCQPYYFKRGTLQDLASAVRRVIEAEGFAAEPEAILSIARCAEGSWRDALSILEQVLAYSEGHVTAATVNRAIGAVGAEMLARVTETLARGEWSGVLAIAAELVDSGADVRQLILSLASHARDLLLIAAGAHGAAQEELGAERYAALISQAALFEPAVLLEMLSVLSAAEREIRFTNQHRWLLERTLLRLMPASRPVRGEVARPVSIPALPSLAEAAEPPRLAATPAVIPRPARAGHAEALPVAGLEDEQEDEPADVEPLLEPSADAQRSVTPPQGRETPEERAQPAESRFAEAVTLEVVQRAWPRILRGIEQQSPSGVAFVKKGQVTGLQGRTVTLTFRETYARDRVQSKGRDLVARKLNQLLGVEGYTVQCVMESAETAGQAPVVPDGWGAESGIGPLLDVPHPVESPARIADFDTPDSSVPPPPPPTPAENGFLQEALEIFGGKVVKTEIQTRL